MEKTWNFGTDTTSASFCNQIASTMVDLFGIPKSEAIQRINTTWAGLSFLGTEDLIYHESEEYWAKNIYYGKDSAWWLPEERRIAEGLGPLKPIQLQNPPNQAL